MTERPPASPLTTLIEPVLALRPSALTREDWIRIYGEEFADWMHLTPAARWRESCRLWVTFNALGGRLHDDFDADSGAYGAHDDATAWRPRPPHGRPGVHSLRRLGV